MLILRQHKPVGSKIRETENIPIFFPELYVACKRAGVWAAPALLAFLCKQYTYLYCRCGDTQPPPLRSPGGWASWLQPQSREDPGGMYTTFSLPPYRHTQGKKINLRSGNTVAKFPAVQVFFFFWMLTSWCLWPAATPTAGACWGTSHHQTSPAALCLVAANWRDLLSLCPLANSPPSRSSWSFLCRSHPPTGKCKDKLKTATRKGPLKLQTHVNFLIYLWGSLRDVGVHQLSTPHCSNHLSFRGFWRSWRRSLVHVLQCFIHSARQIWLSSNTKQEGTSPVPRCPRLTSCSTRPGCSLRRSLVYQQSPAWSSCPCETRAAALSAPPPFSAASLAHWVTTTDWNRWQSSQTRRPKPAFSSRWTWRRELVHA